MNLLELFFMWMSFWTIILTITSEIIFSSSNYVFIFNKKRLEIVGIIFGIIFLSVLLYFQI